VALIHFARNRPNMYWLWIIIMGGPLGAFAYLIMEAVPDARLLVPSFRWWHRRKRMQQLEVMVLDNPAPGNYEEMAELYVEEKKFDKARECYDKAITSRTDLPSPFYGRALCSLHLNDFARATQDLEKVLTFDRKYDYLLAYCYSQTNQPEKADRIFADVVQSSTLSETQYNYACFLAAQQRFPEAREWTKRILNKKATLPSYLKRKERPWFRKAEELLKALPAGEGAGR
jgi:hypothetical protein